MDDVNSERMGEISGFAVYTIFHNITAATQPVSLALKMIIVERQRSEFCEIFQLEGGPRPTSLTSAAYFIDAGEKVLATTDDMPGTAGLRIEAYWTFDKDGPVRLDLTPIAGNEAALLPTGYSVFRTSYFRRSQEPDGSFLGNVESLSYYNVACNKLERKIRSWHVRACAHRV